MKYRPEVDGLRAVAVVPVVLYHAGVQSFDGGYVGVDVFFVISGYLITSLIVEQLAGGAFPLARFYERRARRILPALFVVSLACIPFAWAWMSPPELKDFAQSLAAVVLFVSNALFWLETGYFDQAVELKPLLHTWSLAVEEQFYLLFPLLLIAAARLNRRVVVAAIALTTAASFGLAVYASRAHPSANFYLIPTRAWELGVGALLSFALPALRRRTNLAGVGASIGLVLIGVAVSCFDAATPFPSEFALVPVLGTALVLSSADSDWLAGPVLRHRYVVAVGLASYSLYLWHQPILAFARLRTGGELSATITAGCIVAAMLLAFATWRFVEQPCRDR